jgi:hypothetical protein
MKQMMCKYGILMKTGLWHPLNLSIFAEHERQLKMASLFSSMLLKRKTI